MNCRKKRLVDYCEGVGCHCSSCRWIRVRRLRLATTVADDKGRLVMGLVKRSSAIQAIMADLS